jgi:hypothetical protein
LPFSSADFTKKNGTGGESIYGAPFEDEDLSRPIDSEGCVIPFTFLSHTNKTFRHSAPGSLLLDPSNLCRGASRVGPQNKHDKQATCLASCENNRKFQFSHIGCFEWLAVGLLAYPLPAHHQGSLQSQSAMVPTPGQLRARLSNAPCVSTNCHYYLTLFPSIPNIINQILALYSVICSSALPLFRGR